MQSSRDGPLKSWSSGKESLRFPVTRFSLRPRPKRYEQNNGSEEMLKHYRSSQEPFIQVRLGLFHGVPGADTAPGLWVSFPSFRCERKRRPRNAGESRNVDVQGTRCPAGHAWSRLQGLPRQPGVGAGVPDGAAGLRGGREVLRTFPKTHFLGAQSTGFEAQQACARPLGGRSRELPDLGAPCAPWWWQRVADTAGAPYPLPRPQPRTGGPPTCPGRPGRSAESKTAGSSPCRTRWSGGSSR